MLSTHDVEFVADVADRVVVLADGEMVADGPTAEVVVSSPAFAPQVAKILAPGRWLTVDAACAAALPDGAAVTAPSTARAAAAPASDGRPRRVRAIALRPRSTVARRCSPRSPACWPFGWPLLVDPGAGARPRHRRAAGVRRCCCRCCWPWCCSRSATAAWTPRPWRCSGCCRGRRGAAAARAGTAGIETVFFLLVLGGRVFGRLRVRARLTTLFASALLTGGVGPVAAVPDAGAAWVGLGAGLLPRPAAGRDGAARRYGAVAAYCLRLPAEPVVLAVRHRHGDDSPSCAGRPGARQPAPLPALHPGHLAGAGTPAGPSPTSC